MNEAVWYWLIAAATLVLFEMLSPTFFALLLGLAALVVAALVALLNLSWQAQLLVFSGLALVNLFFWVKIARHWRRSNRQANKLNQRSAHYLGRRLELAEALRHHQGKIQIGDTLWKVQFSEEELPARQLVEVVDVQDNCLIIRPVF